MSAGETLGATVQAYFDAADMRAHDFSIVVVAEKTPVKITVIDSDQESE